MTVCSFLVEGAQSQHTYTHTVQSMNWELHSWYGTIEKHCMTLVNASHHLDCITHKICYNWRRGKKKHTHKIEPLKRSRKELKNHTERAKKNRRRREKKKHTRKRKITTTAVIQRREREIFEAKRISNSSRWPVRFYLQRCALRACLLAFLYLFHFCFLFLAFNQRKNEEFFFISFACSVRSSVVCKLD